MDDLQIKAKKILEKLNPDEKRREARRLEAEMEKPEFWQNREAATEKTKRLAQLQELTNKLEKLDRGEISEELVQELETLLYLSGKYDTSNAIVAIHSGQGGVEAMDWAQMLYRMYTKFVQSQNWKLEEIEYEPGSEAGIKTVAFEVIGSNIYGLLKHEAGVHRLVRQSPFNADHLRQTSFALVEVMPVFQDTTSSEQGTIKEEDLVWDFFRSGGHGGQNVNKVSSAVRLTHKPTGLVVTSQKERDQSRNREIAIKILKAKLLALEEEKTKEEAARLKGVHLTPGWGNQIRSYVLHPYHLVKDLRTDYEESDTDAILNGRLDNFIQAELHFFA
ncbi:PCRF domain-containing protein [Patescibacteria group bacterium]|nr:PCRF domain-containing protein [Patescibacteria group bacterium]